jgi:hypothetical protein
MRPKIMWSTAIVLAGLTLIGLASLGLKDRTQDVVIVILAALSAFALYKVSTMFKDRKNLILEATEQLPTGTASTR